MQRLNRISGRLDNLAVPAYRAAMVTTLVIGLACTMEAGWIHLKASLAQALIAMAWRRAQEGEPGARPWPWADTHPIAKLTVMRYTRKLILLEGASGRNLAFGPTHDPASALPGNPGNSVIEGHRDTHFSVLRDLRVGDWLRVDRADGSTAWFVVADLRVVDSRRWRIALDADRPRLTLVTCYPFEAIRPGGPLRYVVTAELVSGTPAATSAGARRSVPPYQPDQAGSSTSRKPTTASSA